MNRFAITRYPGYLFDTQSQRLFSYKSGILKPLTFREPNQLHPYPGYWVSHNGFRRWMGLDYLKRLKAGPIFIPIQEH